MPAISALHMLDLLCEKKGWKLQLRSTGTKSADAGQSELTEVRVQDPSDPALYASCPLDKPGGAETAARRILIALRETKASLQ